MQSKKAFTLIEILIYLQLSVFIFLIVFNLLFFFCKNLDILQSLLDQKISQQLAVDLIFRDCLSASQYPSEWDFENKVFRKKFLDEKLNLSFKDLGFDIKDKKLIKYEGMYDFSTQKWVDKSSNTLSYNVKNFSFIPIIASEQKNILGLKVVLEFEKRGEHIFYVSLQNRIL
ncbi:TPA: hypothetical protein DEO28_03615 [Candidatus Dependentiae bacterium]|nr:MAG: hypothetical protein UR14_C0007G0024 [candidate division TM6 bacterium GW2011_GWE2_31_21]KKP53615.1 MAG: hypothetical protein UR43_C0004G0156 [candidate division TM6 bacterium GW2011_GWF2_33_332]HBS48145.1 hypothetical protein [Candidatus Dependentiae bacterium]HBZ73569.1 hypothetical protein [Candidatus Dependentiae bacterium]